MSDDYQRAVSRDVFELIDARFVVNSLHSSNISHYALEFDLRVINSYSNYSKPLMLDIQCDKMSAFSRDVRSMMSLALPYEMGSMHNFRSWYYIGEKRDNEDANNDDKMK